MHVIFCLLFIITIIINGFGNQLDQNQIKYQHSPKHFFHSDFDKFRSQQKVQNLQDDSAKNPASVADEDSIQDLEEEKRHHWRLLPVLNNIEREKSLKKRSPKKKKHHHKRKKKKKKKKKKKRKRIKGRKNRLKIHSRNRIGRNELDNPKKFMKKLTKSKSKRYSPFNDIIEYLKSDQLPQVKGNHKRNVKCGTQYCKGHKKHNIPTGIRRPKLPQSYNYPNNKNAKKPKSKNKKKIKRSPFSNYLRRRNNIDSQNRDCEVVCQNKNLDVGSCSCGNDESVEFEKQSKLPNKGGEELEVYKEKPGIFSGIQNFLKNTLKNNEDNKDKCYLLTTTSNPKICQNQDATINSNDIVTTSETNNVIPSENNYSTLGDTNFATTSEINIATTREIISETRSPSTSETSNKIFEYEDNSEFWTEAINSCLHSETSTIVTTTENEIIQTENPTIENNQCITTTPVSCITNELPNEDEGSNDNSSIDKKCKEPLATFLLELKAKPITKKKGFRIRMNI